MLYNVICASGAPFFHTTGDPENLLLEGHVESFEVRCVKYAEVCGIEISLFEAALWQLTYYQNQMSPPRENAFVACADSKGPNQTARTRSLIKAFAAR